MDHVEREFFQFDDFNADAIASLPPLVWVELGIGRNLNRYLDARCEGNAGKFPLERFVFKCLHSRRP